MSVAFSLSSLATGPDGNLWHISLEVPQTGVTFDACAQAYAPSGVIGSGTPQTFIHPGAPIVGTNYVTLQFAMADGTITMKYDFTTYPAADAGCVAFAQQQIGVLPGAPPFAFPGWQMLF